MNFRHLDSLEHASCDLNSHNWHNKIHPTKTGKFRLEHRNFRLLASRTRIGPNILLIAKKKTPNQFNKSALYNIKHSVYTLLAGNIQHHSKSHSKRRHFSVGQWVFVWLFWCITQDNLLESSLWILIMYYNYVYVSMRKSEIKDRHVRLTEGPQPVVWHLRSFSPHRLFWDAI